MNNLIKKGIVIGIICLLMLVSVPTVVSEDGNPDLRILELGIIYEEIPHGAEKKVIRCKVRNFGNASVEYISVKGIGKRLFLWFIPGVSGGMQTSYSLNPGEEKWIKIMEFYASIHRITWWNSGFFNVYINISVPNDLNPRDNIIEGRFLTWGDTIKPL